MPFSCSTAASVETSPYYKKEQVDIGLVLSTLSKHITASP
jgi:hypothetical protein